MPIHSLNFVISLFLTRKNYKQFSSEFLGVFYFSQSEGFCKFLNLEYMVS